MPAIEKKTRRAAASDLILAGLPYLSLLGCAGVFVNVALSFEQPAKEMLLVSALLMAAAPVGLALHLSCTDEFTREERLRWFAGLASRRAPELLSAYFSPASRAKVTRTLIRGSVEVQDVPVVRE